MPLTRAQLQQVVQHLQTGDWQAAHEIVQKDEDSALSCWAHGIVHIMEGDLPNARYWYGQAKQRFPSQPDAAAETRRLKEQMKD